MADQLPVEILRHIFGYLSPADAISVLRVCLVWKGACDDGSVWRSVLYQTPYVTKNSLDDSNISFESWKYYVRADLFSKSLQRTTPITAQVLTWLPYLISIHRK
jgi:hypothetical protein